MKRRSSHRIVLLATLAAALGAPTSAWQPETRVRMVEDAVGLLPASLRLALRQHTAEIRRGVLEPMTTEDEAGHRAPWDDGGTLDRSIVHQAEALREAVDEGRSFALIARRLGNLAHYILDAGFPPGMSQGNADGRYAHYAAFCESRREKWPLVFYGHDDPFLAAGDLRGYAMSIMERAAAEDEHLARTYSVAGDPPAAWAFDDRSVPFAVGSLAYSRSVNDVVKAWLGIWEAAGGDMGRTPYRNRSKKRPTRAGS